VVWQTCIRLEKQSGFLSEIVLLDANVSVQTDLILGC